jgi:hypothetical protein
MVEGETLYIGFLRQSAHLADIHVIVLDVK